MTHPNPTIQFTKINIIYEFGGLLMKLEHDEGGKEVKSGQLHSGGQTARLICTLSFTYWWKNSDRKLNPYLLLSGREKASALKNKLLSTYINLCLVFSISSN